MASPKILNYFPKIILFGDSLTQFSFGPGGFGSAIADHFVRKCDVLNRGFSGYTSQWDKLILPKILKNDNNPPGCIIAAVVLLGTNDSENKDAKNSRNVPIEEYKQNIKNICQQFVDVGIAFQHQILITPPAMVETKWAAFSEQFGFDNSFSNEGIKPYAKACLETAIELEIEVFDLWTEMQKTDNWEDMLSDGLHLSEKGNSFVTKALIPMLDKKLPDLATVFPEWTMVYSKEPEKILCKI